MMTGSYVEPCTKATLLQSVTRRSCTNNPNTYILLLFSLFYTSHDCSKTTATPGIFYQNQKKRIHEFRFMKCLIVIKSLLKIQPNISKIKAQFHCAKTMSLLRFLLKSIEYTCVCANKTKPVINYTTTYIICSICHFLLLDQKKREREENRQKIIYHIQYHICTKEN